MKKITVLVTSSWIVGATIMLAPMAFAEGQWDSYMQDAGVGFRTREWEKVLDDSAHTQWDHRSCNQRSFEMSLKRQRLNGLVPDAAEGDRTMYCNVANVDYGAKGPGRFKFILSRVNGAQSVRDGALPISVAAIRVRY